MYKEHYVFTQPDDENAIIWRYMDFTKFISLLDKSALFFCRADKLGDPFEGSYTEANVGKLGNEQEQFFESIDDKEAVSQIKEMRHKSESRIRLQMSRFTFINCWHLGKYESAAMWRLYLRSNEGVAIKSTFQRLRDCFCDEEREIYIGLVDYVDYEHYEWPVNNYFYPFLHKRKSFEYEKELRAIIGEFSRVKEVEIRPGVKIHTTNPSRPPFRNGIYAEVDLTILIEEILIAPTSPKWLFELAQSAVRKYGLDKKLKHSVLGAKALF